MAKVIDIEGIGPASAEKLQKAGVRSVERLLKECATPKGRRALAEATGLDEKQLLKWANMADLFRIKGVAAQFSELLEAAGVDTVKELRNRNAENLHAKLKEVNDERKRVRQLPSLKQVQGFIEQAKTMEPVITY
jgi:predicted flap endonuclease-1-like 5' DNA nuclease